MVTVEQSAALAYIPLFPLVGAAVAYLVGLKAKDLAGWIATGASVLSFIFTLICFGELRELLSVSAHKVASAGAHGEHSIVENTYRALEANLFNWFSAGNFSVDFLFRFDSLTAVMCLVVTGIGSLIHLYSIGYMAEDESRPRFFSYLNLFMFSMLLLVLGGNLLVLFVGWEGVGLCSYLLIGFWHKNIAFAGAGRKAFVVNRIGDAAFLLALFLLIQFFGSLDFVELKGVISGAVDNSALLTAIALCLFIGATGKSAQIPLFVWLPDAMAGPTPVSALIHAATMVTAGVYLTARMHFLFDITPYASLIVVCIAVLTAIVAASIALVQNDIKKVLAYSTVSQLGFMFVAAGSGAYWVAVFHLVTHAFFKACLFLGSGSVIHACHHEQDMREMGGLWKVMPITGTTYLISTVAIAGIFPLSGYFSKHHIVEALSHSGELNHYLQVYDGPFTIVLTLAAMMTAFYVTRSFAMTFLGEYRGHAHPHESPFTMTIPLIVLAVLALGGGVLNGLVSLQLWLGHSIPVGHVHDSEQILASLIHSWPGLLGVAAALIFYTVLQSVPAKLSQLLPAVKQILADKYYVDELYNAVIVRPLEGMAKLLWKFIDQGVIDGCVNGTAALVDVTGEVV
ncbi:MAG: NADH-quinone oxidoreductase subunit L, partial [Bdellovibrionales bacterium]|nr:NADH-quinone oxidoreductase subunit L [Bdellovibrionales bacterium]